ncbi:esterase/lipase family protein [Leekyejoonella antrihumi]|uniref:Triacylglycerol lipase n=1 Tax=Leekyejoonella antrihumi TaxID=1660198 RepID=A0A563E5A4_9MICO|nr:triacylglycerol lipase [Leekyejoonella antrihumi]TWP37413.1 triacylglycerol lipase [Leekyejoonella antrihumi]
MRILTTALCAAAATSLVITVAAPSASAQTMPSGPPQSSFLAAKALTLVQPDLMPVGVNDWSCRSQAHPRPVVLIPGTWSNAYDSFAGIAPALKARGYCLFDFNYGQSDAAIGKIPGVDATGPVMQSAKELQTFVSTVRAKTGAVKVDLLGWSQGGIVARGFLKFYSGADPSNPAKNQVQNVVTYGATNHGTTLSGLATLAQGTGLNPVIPSTLGQAAVDQEIGSAYLTDLNAGGDTEPGITYTIIGSRADEVTTPYTRTFLTAGPGATVHNVTLQDGCPIDLSDHVSGIYSPRVMALMARGLGSSIPVLPCTPRVPAL